MKTAGRKNPNHGVAWPRNRAHGAEGQNQSRLIKWAEKQEKFRPKEMCFFLTSTFIELIGSALLTSAFAAGIELSQRQNSSLLTTPTAGQTASAAVGQQLGELGSEMTRKNLSIPPTIKVPVGYRFNVRVNRDILFDAPYTPAEQ
jgi:hypothetical protein